MALLTVLTEPDPRLRRVSKPVEMVDDALRQFMDDMIETMHHENGIGLAAPQVNVLKRVIVINCPETLEEDSPMHMIKMVNPVIVEKSEDHISILEACLSVPGEGVTVNRYASIVVEYLDEHNTVQRLSATDLLGICIQHEIDHLDGKLIIDYLSALKKERALKRLIKKRHDD